MRVMRRRSFAARAKSIKCQTSANVQRSAEQLERIVAKLQSQMAFEVWLGKRLANVLYAPDDVPRAQAALADAPDPASAYDMLRRELMTDYDGQANAETSSSSSATAATTTTTTTTESSDTTTTTNSNSEALNDQIEALTFQVAQLEEQLEESRAASIDAPTTALLASQREAALANVAQLEQRLALAEARVSVACACACILFRTSCVLANCLSK
jgi:hypothetical protein